MKSKFDNKELSKRIEKTISDVKAYKDPKELNEIKKIIKKSVPFSLRGYFSAYLILKSGLAASSIEYTNLFVNVGKKHRVYVKTLINFFSKTVNLEKSHFGKIKIFENFSFIEVPKDDAEDIICTVNGKTLNNRTITVNYAKTKSKIEEIKQYN